MITFYVRHAVGWWTENIVRKVLGVFLIVPLSLVAFWFYGQFLYWLLQAIGMPVPAAEILALMSTIATVGGIVAVVLSAALD